MGQIPSMPYWGVFEIEGYCAANHVPINCSTKFFDNGTVQLFGGVGRRHIHAEVDIAGYGTVFAFMLSGAAALFTSLILIWSIAVNQIPKRSGRPRRFVPKPGPRGRISQPEGRSERFYNFFETSLRTISDVQTLLALALAASFIVINSCKILQYHLMIVNHILLAACATYLQSLSLVRHYWRSWIASFAGLLRLLCVVGILLFLGSIFATQNAPPFRDKRPFISETRPSFLTNDSAIFLKAACFLDPDLEERHFGRLQQGQRVAIGILDNPYSAIEWILWLLLTITIGLTLVVRTLSSCCGRLRHHPDRPPPTECGLGAWFNGLYWSWNWLLSSVTFGYSAYSIAHVRAWTSRSGWLEVDEKGGNPENDIRGFGQTAALVSLAAVVIAVLDSTAENKKEKQKRVGTTV